MTQSLWRGEPIALLLDEAAIGDSDRVRELLHALGLQVIMIGTHPATLATQAVGIFGDDVAPIRGCHAWYVGSGAPPRWMHWTLGRGVATTMNILRMLGTALAQEQATVAVRAAAAGRPPPEWIMLEPGVLRGVDHAVAPLNRQGSARPAVAADPESLLRKSFVAIEACCADNGAIAVAPAAESGDPDHWFCRPHDAAATAIALHALARSGPADLRAAAAARCQGYLGFVEQIGHGGRLAAARLAMNGTAVSGYGDPQHDGPAATTLAVLTLDPSALSIARPFLEQLLLPGPRKGFDLWELVEGRSFHAANLRRRALGLAASLAAGVDDELAARCRVVDERPTFVDPAGGWRHILDPFPTWFRHTSRLDASVLGSALLAHDDDGEIRHPQLRQTANRLVAHYATRWPVNVAWRRAGNQGGGIGRFPEDANDGYGSGGGNPWPIATLWLAQYHFHRGERDLAEGYLGFVLAHVDAEAISEQIDAATGEPRGARGLARAHAELVITLLLKESR
ncbi:MAG TPA: glycoside hydrolase family 15 protein [Sporichthyaceae bacterium]